jgi:hypothetical protein
MNSNAIQVVRAALGQYRQDIQREAAAMMIDFFGDLSLSEWIQSSNAIAYCGRTA